MNFLAIIISLPSDHNIVRLMPIAMFDLSYYVTQNCLVRTVVKAPKYFHISHHPKISALARD